MKSREKFSRRAFLKATGISPLLLPLVEPQLARAGCLPNGPKRAVFVVWPNGILPENKPENWPSARSGPTDFSLSRAMQSLEPYRKDLLFLDKLNYRFLDDTPIGKYPAGVNGHLTHQGLLTGRRMLEFRPNGDNVAAGPSIDRYLGSELKKLYPHLLPSSLYLGVFLTYPAYAVHDGPNKPVAPFEDPLAAFSAVFSGRTSGVPDPEIERARQGQKSVLDFVAKDLVRFGQRLGTEDGYRIQRHLDSIRTIENEILAVRPVLVDTCVPKSAPAAIDKLLPENLPKLMQLQMDILVAAMAADVTRVAVLQFADGQGSNLYFPWLNLATGTRASTFHEVKHETVPGSFEVDSWIYQQWAYLIGRLNDEKEGDKRMLDTSVVTFMNNMTLGLHTWNDVPAFLAGSCGGYFKTGRCVKNTAPSAFHPPLLVSIANAMGFDQLQSWGDPEYNSGPMPGLT